jgi:hypothetical protein
VAKVQRLNNNSLAKMVERLMVMLKATLGIIGLVLAAAVMPAFAQGLSPEAVVSAAPSTVVVDGKGRAVGSYFPVTSYEEGSFNLQINDSVLLKVGASPGLWIILPVAAEGFIATGESDEPELYYTSTNCSGTAYMKPSSGGLTVLSATYAVAGGILYYPAPGPTKRITSLSFNVPGGNLADCDVLGPHSRPPVLNASLEQTFKLSSLGFVPPFKISSLVVLP